MKVLLVNKYFYPRGGSETYFFSLAEALTAVGHEVAYFSMAHPENLPCAQAEDFVSGVDFHAKVSPGQKLRAARRVIYSREAKDKLGRLLARERPDIVHVNNIHRQLTLSVLDACEEYGCPVVATCHDWIWVCPNYLKLANGRVCEKCQNGRVLPCALSGCVQGSRSWSLLAAAEGYAARRRGSYDKIALYIAPSHFMAERLRAAGFTKSPIIHMTNFLPSLDFPVVPPADPPYFLYLGRLTEEKGLPTLLRAYAAAGTRAGLCVAGDGPLRPALETLAATLGIQVRFTGPLRGEALRRVAGRCLALVAPSEWLENCPYSVMEALAMGKPVIGSRIGGIPALVEDGVTGFLCEPVDKNALAAALKKLEALSAGDYADMSAAARAFAGERFCRDAYVTELLAHYRALCGKRGES